MLFGKLLLFLIIVGTSFQSENEHIISAISWNTSNTSFIAIGYQDGIIEIIDLSNNTIQSVLQIDSRPIIALKWSHNGEILASSSYFGQNTTITIWDMTLSQPTPLLIELEYRPVRSLAFNSANDELLTVDTYYGLRVWEIQTGALLLNPSPPGFSILAINLPSNQLATASSAPIFLRWDLSSGYHSVESSPMMDNGIPAIDQEVSALAWNECSDGTT